MPDLSRRLRGSTDRCQRLYALSSRSLLLAIYSNYMKALMILNSEIGHPHDKSYSGKHDEISFGVDQYMNKGLCWTSTLMKLQWCQYFLTGMHKPSHQTMCQICSSGFYQVRRGQENCDLCPENHYCPVSDYFLKQTHTYTHYCYQWTCSSCLNTNILH